MMIVPLVALGLLWFFLARPGAIARLVRAVDPRASEKAASIALVVAALVVLGRGNAWAALLLFGAGLWLLGRAARRAGQREAPPSPMRSRLIEMTLDRKTGRPHGRLLDGRGTSLDTLDRAQCQSLLATCRREDPEGVRLLEPYLDRRFPGWRTAHHADNDARERRARFTSRMSEDEAYQVLGLGRGASRDDIVRSHRTVMKKWHPDQGGSADLAARANEAKEVLLRRHA